MSIPRLDRSALKVNQAGIIAFLTLAYVLNVPWLVVLVAAVMLVGTALPDAALFKQLYLRVLRSRLVQPQVVEEDPAPHQFAQGLGGLVLAAAGLALYALGSPTVGWGLSLVVALLALVNLAAGFCAGCFLYFQLGRLGLLGSGARARDGRRA